MSELKIKRAESYKVNTGVGRPTYDYARIADDYIRFINAGFSHNEILTGFGITDSTWNKWYKRYEFAEVRAMNKGRELVLSEDEERWREKYERHKEAVLDADSYDEVLTGLERLSLAEISRILTNPKSRTGEKLTAIKEVLSIRMKEGYKLRQRDEVASRDNNVINVLPTIKINGVAASYDIGESADSYVVPEPEDAVYEDIEEIVRENALDKDKPQPDAEILEGIFDGDESSATEEPIDFEVDDDSPPIVMPPPSIVDLDVSVEPSTEVKPAFDILSDNSADNISKARIDVSSLDITVDTDDFDEDDF